MFESGVQTETTGSEMVVDDQETRFVNARPALRMSALAAGARPDRLVHRSWTRPAF